MTGFTSGGPSFAQEDLSLLARLLRVFYDPRRSFAAVAGRESAHDWLLPVLLACAVGLVAHQLTLDLQADLESPEVQEQMENMSEEEREQYAQGMQMLRTYGWMMVPLGLFTSLVVVAVVALLLVRNLFDADATFRQMLVVKAYASMVLVPEWVVRTLLMLARGSTDVHTGPGAFVPEEMARTFTGRLLIAVNLFDLWQIWVIGIGIAVLAGASHKKAVLSLLVLWLLWIAGGAIAEGAAPAPPAP